MLRPAMRPVRTQLPRKVPFQGSPSVDAAAAETGGFADGIETRNGLLVAIQYPAVQIGLDAAQTFAAEDELADGDQGPSRRIVYFAECERTDACGRLCNVGSRRCGAVARRLK